MVQKLSNVKTQIEKKKITNDLFLRHRERRRSRTPDRNFHEFSRKREESPFSKAHSNWKKFKQAEKVMSSAMERKRDIFDKRPEDHPNYPEEWKQVGPLM